MLIMALTPRACKVSPWEGDGAGNHISPLLKPWWRWPEQASPSCSATSSCSDKPPRNAGAAGKEKRHGRLEMDKLVLSATLDMHTHTFEGEHWSSEFLKIMFWQLFSSPKAPLEKHSETLRNLPALLILHFLEESVAFKFKCCHLSSLASSFFFFVASTLNSHLRFNLNSQNEAGSCSTNSGCSAEQF